MTPHIGTTKHLGFDDTNHERRERVTAICECPTCGEDVALWSDTEEWRQGTNGRWYHLHYSACSIGECCGKVLIDTDDGCMVLDLE